MGTASDLALQYVLMSCHRSRTKEIAERKYVRRSRVSAHNREFVKRGVGDEHGGRGGAGRGWWLHALVKVKAVGQISVHRCCSGIGSQQKARRLKHGGCDGIGTVA